MPAAIRGRGFETLATVEEARSRFLRRVPAGPLAVEAVRIAEAAGRVLASPLRSTAPVPPFDRAAMDGLAVRARDTFGASAVNPLPLRLVGESKIGRPPTLSIKEGTCARIATGAMLPGGSNAVVMLEQTKDLGRALVEVQSALTPWENVSRRGEDVRAGETLLARGARLQPPDIALASALGLVRVTVARRPRVGVLSTGNELRSPGERLRPGEVFDSNRPGALAALREAGAHRVDLGIARDTHAAIRSKIARGLRGCDMVVISGGTSVGEGDLVPAAVASLGRPGIVVHGVAMRPGYPVALGAVGRKPVLILPGSPVAAALNIEEFAIPAVRKMLGEAEPQWPRGATLTAKAARRIPGAAGLTTYARVVVFEEGGALVAEPIRISGSGILSSLVRGSGIVVIPPQTEGFEEGGAVTVRLLRPLPSHPRRPKLPEFDPTREESH